MPHDRNERAFSLIEVVLALAVFVFAGFAMIGLLTVGLQGNRDSEEQLQAATIAEQICSTLRSTPASNFTSSSYPMLGFPIPNITNSVGLTTNYLTWDGLQTNQTYARFGMLYRVNASTNYVPLATPGTSTLYLYIYWPALASPNNSASGHFELTSTFFLP